MSNKKVCIKPVPMFEISLPDGTSLGNFERASKWKGMSEFVDIKGRTIILDDHNEDGSFSAMFREIFARDQAVTVDVVKASLSLEELFK